MVFPKNGSAGWSVHPGEILREEFLEPLGLTSYALAKAVRLPVPRVHDIVKEKRGISADTALRFSRYFGTSVEFWMNLQAAYEIRKAARNARGSLKSIRPLKRASVA